MSHTLATLMILARVTSFCVGVVALYVAFFLYEDEEGAIKNRLEQLWCRIDDRAKKSGSTTASLLNSAGSRMDLVMNRLFGMKLLSTKAVVTSLDLSTFGIAIYPLTPFFPLKSSFGIFTVLLAGLACTSLYAAVSSVPPIFSRILRATPIVGLFLLLGLLLPMAYTPLFGSTGKREIIESIATGIVLVIASVMSDFAWIVLIRKLSRFLAGDISVFRLIVAFWALLVLPLTTISVFVPSLWPMELRLSVSVFLLGTALMNLVSALLCLIPSFVVLGLLLHLALWPVLSRVVYPAARSGVVGSRKTLSAVGILSLTIAFNLEQVGFKAFLKILN